MPVGRYRIGIFSAAVLAALGLPTGTGLVEAGGLTLRRVFGSSAPCDTPVCDPIVCPGDECPPEAYDPDHQPAVPDGGVPAVPEAPALPQTPASTANLPQLASSSLDVAPGMIGDLFGTAQSGSVIALDRLALGGIFTEPADFSSVDGRIIGSNGATVFLFRPPVDDIDGLVAGANAQGPILSAEPLGPLTAVSGLSNQFATIDPASFPPGTTIIATRVAGPPGSYDTAANAAFVAANGAGGTTILDAGASGAGLRQGPGMGQGTGPQAGVAYFYDYVLAINIPNPGGGGGGAAVGRQKITENTSPMPRDRVFVNYSFFDNAAIFDGIDVHRVTPGFEKTFFDGMSSIEVRFPFASTLDSDIIAGGATSTSEIEFGNMNLFLKTLLAGGGRRDDYAISAGLGFALPTADDVRVFDTAGSELIAVDNEAVHLLPFIGGLYAPNDRLFVQGFIQFDFDANGNPVYTRNAGTLTRAGSVNDPTFIFVDAGVGYWMHRSRRGRITGIAPTAELHYNRTLQDTDVVTSGPFQVGNVQENIEILNAVFGLNMTFRNNLNVTAGYTVPIGGGADQQFDGEFRLQANWLFGRSNRLSRAFGL